MSARDLRELRETYRELADPGVSGSVGGGLLYVFGKMLFWTFAIGGGIILGVWVAGLFN